MKRSIAILLGMALATGAGLAYAGKGGGGGGGGRGGGGSHAGGGHAFAGGSVAGRPGMSGGFTRFTTGPTRFTTGPHPSRPIAGIRPGPVVVPRPGFPHNRVIVGGAVVVSAPLFWYPPYPYPYPYSYVAPAYGGPAYAELPTYSDSPAYSDQGYSERNDYWYYCPDSQTYYPYVQTCASPWVQVLPEPGAPGN